MSSFLVISTASDMLRVRHDNIVYITSDGNYSQLLLSGGEIRLLTMQLGQVERLIDSQLGTFKRNFIRIGKSLIINNLQKHLKTRIFAAKNTPDDFRAILSALKFRKFLTFRRYPSSLSYICARCKYNAPPSSEFGRK